MKKQYKMVATTLSIISEIFVKSELGLTVINGNFLDQH